MDSHAKMLAIEGPERVNGFCRRPGARPGSIARVSCGFTFGSQMAGRENTGLREPWDPNGRAPRGLRPRCGARTRKNMGYGVKRSPTGPLRQSWRAIDRAKT